MKPRDKSKKDNIRKKSKVREALIDGLLELILTFICFGIGFGFLAIFDLTDCSEDGELTVLIGVAVIAVIALLIFGIIRIFIKSTPNLKKGEKMETKYYTVTKIEGEYAYILEENTENELFIAMALLPDGVDIGTKLKYEMLSYEIQGTGDRE